MCASPSITTLGGASPPTQEEEQPKGTMRKGVCCLDVVPPRFCTDRCEHTKTRRGAITTHHHPGVQRHPGVRYHQGVHLHPSPPLRVCITTQIGRGEPKGPHEKEGVLLGCSTTQTLHSRCKHTPAGRGALKGPHENGEVLLDAVPPKLYTLHMTVGRVGDWIRCFSPSVRGFLNSLHESL